MPGKTFVEKVLAAHAGLKPEEVVPGQIVTCRPDHLLAHDNFEAIAQKVEKQLEEFGLCSAALPIVVLDHAVPAPSEKIAQGHQYIRNFVKKYKVTNFYDAGTGVCHQVVVEKGHALPGTLIVGSDSHTCTYGATNCMSTGVDRTEAAALLLTGELWLRVPPTIKVVLTGKLQKGVTSKDLVLHIAGDISASGAAYSTLEFHGDVQNLTMDDRLTISNMGVEMDSKGAVFPCDDVCKAYLAKQGVDVSKIQPVWADADAVYERVLQYDMGKIVPVVAKPHAVDNIVPAASLAGTKVDQFFLGTCTNGRYVDLRQAADILKGKQVADGCRLIVCPASRAEYEKALRDDTIVTLVQAGAMLLPTGCGPCLGAHQGVPGSNEVVLSTANRNFKGRMGNAKSFIYLASPLTVAASAIKGAIVDPREFMN